MRSFSAWMCILGAAIIMVAVSLAPSVAEAHAAHNMIPEASVASPAKEHAKSASPISSQELWAATASDNTGSLPVSHSGKCCSKTSCTPCCAIDMSADRDLLPAQTPLRTRMPDSVDKDGIRPQALRKPPRSFA